MKRHKEHAVGTATVDQDISLVATGTTAELSGILAACNECLLDLHKQAVDIAFAEAATIQAAWLKAVTAMVQMAPQAADRANTARMIEIVNGWFQVVTQAQTALVELIGKSALADASGLPNTAQACHPVTAERRKLALVINFPERRRAA